MIEENRKDTHANSVIIQEELPEPAAGGGGEADLEAGGTS